MSVALKPGASAVVVGGAIADGQTLDKALRRLIAELDKSNPDLAKMLNLDAASVGDVRLHVASITVTDEGAVRLVGKECEAAVGISDQRLYVGMGSGATKLLKATIAKANAAAAKEGPFARISISGKAIAEFIAAGRPGKRQASAARCASVLQQVGDKDHLVYTKNPAADGISLRIEAEEGLLKLLGTLLNFAPAASKSSHPADAEASPF